MATDKRNTRNNPYLLDDIAARMHRSAAGSLWRWRTEASLLVVFGSGFGWLAIARGALTAGLVLAAVISVVAFVPPSRRFATRRAWCLLSRHRLQRVCWETRMHTRSGRIPLVAWIRPTDVGERAWVICRAGVCAEDFDAHAGEIRAACCAREARITRDVRWSQLVVIDIIRRDTLSAARHVHPHILTRDHRETAPAAQLVPAPGRDLAVVQTPIRSTPRKPAEHIASGRQ